MSCEEHARLEQEHSQAKARYDDARRALDHKIGVSPRGEFLHLRRAIDEAGVALERELQLRGLGRYCAAGTECRSTLGTGRNKYSLRSAS